MNRKPPSSRLPAAACRLRRLALLLAPALLGLAACGPASRNTGGQHGGNELVIVASNGLKDLEFLQPQMEAAVGKKIRLEYAGTVEMADKLRESGANVADFAWPASGFYLHLNVPQRILATEKIARSPVVLGLKRTRAEELGWLRQAPTWEEIARTVKKENLALGMTNPIASDLGLAALLAATVATAKGPGLQPADIDFAKLRSLYSGTALIGGSAGWLADSYLKQEARLDGMINYESRILGLNARGQLNTPLAVIRPRDGSVYADYPLMLVNPARRPDFARLVAFLRSDAVQQQIVNRTWRRPVATDVALPEAFGGKAPKVLAEPARPEFVDAMLGAYQGELRLPAHSYFVLDVSGSMAEEHRMEDLKSALMVLAGSDRSTMSGRYARFQPRERADLTTFDSAIVDRLSLDFGAPAGYDPALGKFADFVAALQPKGGTAIYDALQATYEQALRDRKQQPGYYYSIVVMTDGENSSGRTFEAFRNWYQELPDTAQDIPVFTILFGESDPAEMNALAELTDGRVFDAKSAGLTAVFKDIRGYQ